MHWVVSDNVLPTSLITVKMVETMRRLSTVPCLNCSAKSSSLQGLCVLAELPADLPVPLSPDPRAFVQDVLNQHGPANPCYKTGIQRPCCSGTRARAPTGRSLEHDTLGPLHTGSCSGTAVQEPGARERWGSRSRGWGTGGRWGRTYLCFHGGSSLALAPAGACFIGEGPEVSGALP